MKTLLDQDTKVIPATCGCGYIVSGEEEYLVSSVGVFCDEVCMIRHMNGYWVGDNTVMIEGVDGHLTMSLEKLKKIWMVKRVG